jgi:phage baseplate assembly protein W
MNILGSTISFPFRSDNRGAMATTSTDDNIIAQAIIDVIETRQGERVMLPNYGLPDLLFDVLDASFAARLAFFIEEQIRSYVLAVRDVKAEAGEFESGQFTANALPATHKAAVRVNWTKRGEAVPQELIYPTWRLIK